MYGGYGAASGGVFLDATHLASAITSCGRELISWVSRTCEQRWPIHCVYGDSVMADTPVLVRIRGIVRVVSIEALATDWAPYPGFKWGEQERWQKEQALGRDLEAWTAEGWAPVVRVIRHRCTKKIFRVLTQSGLVDVTEDHSLLDAEGHPVKPKDVARGSSLLHLYPDVRALVLDTTRGEFLGTFHNLRRVHAHDKLTAARYYTILRAMGFNVRIDCRQNKPDVVCLKFSLKKMRRPAAALKRITVLHEAWDGYVYDLETQAGSFQVH